MNYSNQEIKNHRRILISIILQFFLLLYIGVSIKSENYGLASMEIMFVMLNTIWIFYIGYSHGWELKRLSDN